MEDRTSSMMLLLICTSSTVVSLIYWGTYKSFFSWGILFVVIHETKYLMMIHHDNLLLQCIDFMRFHFFLSSIVFSWFIFVECFSVHCDISTFLLFVCMNWFMRQGGLESYILGWGGFCHVFYFFYMFFVVANVSMLWLLLYIRSTMDRFSKLYHFIKNNTSCEISSNVVLKLKWKLTTVYSFLCSHKDTMILFWLNMYWYCLLYVISSVSSACFKKILH